MVSRVDIKKLFAGMQSKMIATLQAQSPISHPGAKGGATELNWLDWFIDYFPKRYSFCNGFVIDSNGNLSDQIDIIVYDKLYSPLVFNQNGINYVTAESVFAVFEVKQNINKEHILYAGHKASSVRNLIRTSAPIVYSTGTKPPKSPHRIIAGLLTTTSDWKAPIDEILSENLKSLKCEEEIDIICALDTATYKIKYTRTDIKLLGEKRGEFVDITLNKNDSNDVLIFLFLTFLLQLQVIGTVPAIEYDKYFAGIPTIEETYEEIKKSENNCK